MIENWSVILLYTYGGSHVNTVDITNFSSSSTKMINELSETVEAPSLKMLLDLFFLESSICAKQNS